MFEFFFLFIGYSTDEKIRVYDYKKIFVEIFKIHAEQKLVNITYVRKYRLVVVTGRLGLRVFVLKTDNQDQKLVQCKEGFETIHLGWLLACFFFTEPNKDIY